MDTHFCQINGSHATYIVIDMSRSTIVVTIFWEFFEVLPNFPFTISEIMSDH